MVAWPSMLLGIFLYSRLYEMSYIAWALPVGAWLLAWVAADIVLGCVEPGVRGRRKARADKAKYGAAAEEGGGGGVNIQL